MRRYVITAISPFHMRALFDKLQTNKEREKVRRIYSVVWILLQDYEPLHDGRDGQVLLRGELGPLSAGEQHGRGVRLEAGDGLGLARLPDHVDGLADPHADRQRAQLVVEGDQHARLHGRRQRVEEVVALAQDGGLDVEEAEEIGS